MNDEVKVATWNILSDGLYDGEFLTPEGDDSTLVWEKRKNKIYSCLASFFNNGGDIFATQENDRPNEILKGVQAMCPQENIEHVICLKHKKESQGKRLASKRRVEEDEAIVINDTITVYYNSKNVSLLPTSRTQGGNTSELMGDPDDLVKLNQNPNQNPNHNHNLQSALSQIDLDSELAAMLTFKKNEKTFVVVNAHLKSGENAEAAKKRNTQMTDIMTKITALDSTTATSLPIILLMDSNSSKHYPSSDGALSPTENANVELGRIYSPRFKNIVGDEKGAGFECFKMRHGAGGQPNKYGELMFDTIDKILISNDFSFDDDDVNIIPTFIPWHRHANRSARRRDTIEDHIYNLRTNKYLRYAMKACVFGANNLSNINMYKLDKNELDKSKIITLDKNNFEIIHKSNSGIGVGASTSLENVLKSDEMRKYELDLTKTATEKVLHDESRFAKDAYNSDVNFNNPLGLVPRSSPDTINTGNVENIYWDPKTLVKAVKKTFDTSTVVDERIRGQTTIPNETCHIENITDKDNTSESNDELVQAKEIATKPLFPADIKNRMYPNMGAPSDHPPIEAILTLSKSMSSDAIPTMISAPSAPASYANVVAGTGTFNPSSSGFVAQQSAAIDRLVQSSMGREQAPLPPTTTPRPISMVFGHAPSAPGPAAGGGKKRTKRRHKVSKRRRKVSKRGHKISRKRRHVKKRVSRKRRKM